MTDPIRTLLLARHGRTAWNAEARAQGHLDVPLDEDGEEQAATLASALSGRTVQRIWSSDLQRAARTADVIASGVGLPVDLDARLREFDVGERQGLTVTEFAERFPELPTGWEGYVGGHGVPGAESVDDVRQRVVLALRECAAALKPGETGVVVMHGAALRVGLFGLLDWSWEQVLDVAPIRNCHLVEVRFDAEDRVQLVAYNTSG